MRGVFTSLIFYLIVIPTIILVFLYIIWVAGGFNNCDVCLSKIDQILSIFK
jgi:TM2 domain-containing membrane protein YozV